MFQTLIKYFEVPKTINPVVISCKSIGLSNEFIKPPTTKNNSLNPKLDYFNNPKFRVEFEESCLKPVAKQVTPNNKKISFYIVYEIKLRSLHNSGKFSARNSLFGTVNPNQNADPEKYSYSGCGILFDLRGSYSLKKWCFW